VVVVMRWRERMTETMVVVMRSSLFDYIGMLWHWIKLSMRLQYHSLIIGRAIVSLSSTWSCSMVHVANLCCRMAIVPLNARSQCVLVTNRTTVGMFYVSRIPAAHCSMLRYECQSCDAGTLNWPLLTARHVFSKRLFVTCRTRLQVCATSRDFKSRSALCFLQWFL
jgi:hypothetical protein